MYTRRGASRKMRLTPIDSTKNMVQFNTAVPAATAVVVALAKGVNPTLIDEGDAAKTYYVEENSMVRGFSISLRTFNESGVADSNSTMMYVRKNDGYLPVPTVAQSNSLGTAPWKNYVFHVEQAITGSQVSGFPMGFPSIKIPKRFHRLQKDAVWELVCVNNTANQIRMCGICIYKWYK